MSPKSQISLADFQIEFAEVKMRKPDLMEPPLYRAPPEIHRRGLVRSRVEA